jgi:2-oxoglutarate dehydrogenase E2 component (dihydrolipoamide succinyltransferase)
MRRSLDTAAHALVVVEVDWGAVDAVRRDAGLTFLPFVARSAMDALRDFPHLNATFDGDRLVVHRRVHLGVAVDVEHEALLVPVVRGAESLRLPALADAIAERADQARRRRLPGDAFDGGTFTLTNVGSYGTVTAFPIITPGQVAILSSDGVKVRPVAVRGVAGADEWSIAVRPTGNLSLSFDHRAVDGAYAAAFLARVRDQLQERDWGAEVAR